MALELANYDYTKVEWVANNCTVYDFVKRKCYKKYIQYIETEGTKKMSNSNSSELES